MTGLIYYKVETEKNYNSIIQVPKLIEYLKKRKKTAIGIADIQAMYSAMDLYDQAKKANMEPLLSIQVKVTGMTKEENLFVTLVAKNYSGYIELVKLINVMNFSEDEKEKGKILPTKRFISISEIPEMKNVIATLSIKPYIEEDRTVYIQALVNKIMQRFGKENAWIELEPAFNGKERKLQQKTTEYAKKQELVTIAAPTIRYFKKSEKKVMDILESLRKKRKVIKTNAPYGYFFSDEEEIKAFEQYPESIKQTHLLADMCSIEFPLKGTPGYERKMPEFEVPEDFKIPEKLPSMFNPNSTFVMPTEESKVRQIAYLCSLAWKKFLEFYREHPSLVTISERLKMELGTTISNDFGNYFLNVQDFMKYARENGILTGPGRGSAAGSLLAYCLEIITVDPIPHNLLFERFLNEARVKENKDEPDIDIDFSKLERYKIFRYGRQKHGIFRVAKIITFNPYGAKKTIEYVAKELGISEEIVKKLKEKIDDKKGRVEHVFREENFIPELLKTNPEVKELLDIALIIQEMPESRGNHAAGMVLSKNDFRTELPLIQSFDDELGEIIPVIQFTKDSKHLENLGFTKIDFLYLRTLDVIGNAKKMVWERKGIDLTDIPLDDEEVYRLYQSGNLIGVFQLDSEKMRETAKATKPTNFRDIINLVALYRPGAMDEIDNYVANKKANNRIIYDVEGNPIQGVEELEEILRRTYGIIVYQEQIMMIAGVWSGFTLGEADILRRAISTKNRDVLEKEREKFVGKAKEKGRDEATSNKIYDLIVKFAEFGFNESHSVAYAELSYTCAYLKAKYPVEFMSALISSKMDKTIEAADYVTEARRMGIKVAKPSIETSREEFVPNGDVIEFGLPMIKDVGVKPIVRLVEERKKRPFLNFTDFLNRMHSNEVNKKVLKALIAVGAFDTFGNQNQLLQLLEEKTEPMKLPKSQRLFTDLSEFGYDLIESLPKLEDLTLEEKIDNQKKFTYLVLEPSPTEGKAEIFSKLLQKENKVKKWFGGAVINKHVFKDVNKNEMAYVFIQGAKRENKLTVFASEYEKYAKDLDLFSYILFTARKDPKRNQFILQQAEKIEELRMLVTLPMEVIKMNKEEKGEWMNQFENIVKMHPGNEILSLGFRDRHKEYRASLSDALLKDLCELVKEEAIAIEKVR